MVTPEVRAAMMRAVKSRDTQPEMLVRRLLHSLGYRYRLHRKDLPGKPDIVFPSRKKVIFVHGCFWHKHEGCENLRVPKSRTDYWGPKLKRNIERDAQAVAQLRDAGWAALIVWECELKPPGLAERMQVFLGPAGNHHES